MKGAVLWTRFPTEGNPLARVKAALAESHPPKEQGSACLKPLSEDELKAEGMSPDSDGTKGLYGWRHCLTGSSHIETPVVCQMYDCFKEVTVFYMDPQCSPYLSLQTQ